jgi:hypothetical protein
MFVIHGDLKIGLFFIDSEAEKQFHFFRLISRIEKPHRIILDKNEKKFWQKIARKIIKSSFFNHLVLSSR